MSELREPITISGAQAELVAYRRYGGDHRVSHVLSDWKLSLYIRPPNGRYNGAIGDITSDQLPMLVKVLRRGLTKIEELEAMQLTAGYRADIPFVGSPRLEIAMNGGRGCLRLGLFSSTGSLWYTSFSAGPLRTLILTLEAVAERGPALAKLLEQIAR